MDVPWGGRKAHEAVHDVAHRPAGNRDAELHNAADPGIGSCFTATAQQDKPVEREPTPGSAYGRQYGRSHAPWPLLLMSLQRNNETDLRCRNFRTSLARTKMKRARVFPSTRRHV